MIFSTRPGVSSRVNDVGVAPRRLARVECLVLLIAFWLAAEARVLAYLDPGTGNLLIQALLSVAIGLSFWARRFLGRVGRLFGRSNRQSSADGNRDSDA